MAKILYAAGTIAHIRSFHTDYINALKSMGNEVVVMANGKGADIDIAFEKKMLSLDNLKCQRRIRSIIKEGGYDAILLNTTLAAFNVRMALPRKGRPRVVNLMHGYMFKEKPCGIKERIFLFVEKFLRSKTDAVIVMNEEDLVSAKKYRLTKGRIEKIRGMGARVPDAALSCDEIRKRLESSDNYVIAFTGELCGAKNQSQLIRILPSLKERIPGVKLWLLGCGKAEEELKALADELGVSDITVFPGYVKGPTDYIRASDLYVTPSKKEGLPFNLIEVLGVGKPIIASNIKGHRDLIEDGVSGLLYESESDGELITKILDIYSGKVSLDKDTQLSTYVKYSKDEVFEETLGVMKDLLEI